MCHWINLRFECGCFVKRKKKYCVLYPICKEEKETHDDNWVADVCPDHIGKPNPHLLLFGPADKRFWGGCEGTAPPFGELHAYVQVSKDEGEAVRERYEQEEKDRQREEYRQRVDWEAECEDRREAEAKERQEIQRRELKRRTEDVGHPFWGVKAQDRKRK